MSILTTNSPFLLNSNAHGLFSSQSAFQKPKLFNPSNTVSHNYPTLPNHKNPLNKRSNPTKPAQNTEDFELLECEPVKKTKLNLFNLDVTAAINASKTRENPKRPSQLSLDQVFSTPIVSQKLQKSAVFEEISEEGSSLSFISSLSSLDEMEDLEEKAVEIVERQEEDDCKVMEIVNNTQNVQPTLDSLVMRSDVISRFNLQGQGNLYSHGLMAAPMIFPGVNQSYDLLNNLQVHNQFLSYQYPTIDMNAYRISQINLNSLLERAAEQQFEAQVQEYRAKMGLGEEEGYDSDSHATRSTCVEPSLTGDNKSQKAASPQYSLNSDIYEEEKPKAEKRETRQNKQGKQRKENKGKASKKGRSANVQIDAKPQHLKVERGLNRLQVLRYQQACMEDENVLVKNTENLQVYRAVSTISTDIQSTTSEETYEPICPSLLATIPALNSVSVRARRTVVAPVWVPGTVQEEKVEEFLLQLEEITENPVTNQERAVKLLKTYKNDMEAALEAVMDNTPVYKEMFRIKPRRERRKVYA